MNNCTRCCYCMRTICYIAASQILTFLLFIIQGGLAEFGVLLYYCIDQDPSEQRRRNVKAKTRHFLRPKLYGAQTNKNPTLYIIIIVEKLHAHQNRNAPSGLTSAHCDWVCHAMHKNVCMLEWHAIKHPYLPTYLGCMIKLLIYFYAS